MPVEELMHRGRPVAVAPARANLLCIQEHAALAPWTLEPVFLQSLEALPRPSKATGKRLQSLRAARSRGARPLKGCHQGPDQARWLRESL